MSDQTPKLTGKEQVFISEYLSNGFNATQAALSAGYHYKKASTLRRVASELRAKPHIKAEIDKTLEERAFKPGEVLDLMKEQATVDMSWFVSIDDEGEPYFDFQRALSLGKTHLIKSMKISERYGITLELVDGQSALLALAKHYKLFTDQTVEAKVELGERFEEMLMKVYAPRMEKK